jgi:hypothetical protein
VLYAGDPAAGVPLVEPLRALGPEVDLIQPMPYTAFQGMLDPSAPPGKRSYWRGEYLRELSVTALETFLDHGAALTAAGPPFSQTVMFRVGQGIAAVGDEASAFSHRDAGYLFHPISMWEDQADDDRLIVANRVFCDAMRPHTTGAAYLNFSPEDRVRDAFGAAKHERLVGLKDRYDPGNLFRLNQNIKPSKEAAEPALA